MTWASGDAAVLITRARDDVGLSQQALAEAVGLDRRDLASIESGLREPSPELLARILRAARLRPSIPLELFAQRVRVVAADYGLHDVRVFGSVVRGSDTERSDVDLLVSADDDVDFLTLAAFRKAAEDIIGFPVDAVIDADGTDVITHIRREAVTL